MYDPVNIIIQVSLEVILLSKMLHMGILVYVQSLWGGGYQTFHWIWSILPALKELSFCTCEVEVRTLATVPPLPCETLLAPNPRQSSCSDSKRWKNWKCRSFYRDWWYLGSEMWEVCIIHSAIKSGWENWVESSNWIENIWVLFTTHIFKVENQSKKIHVLPFCKYFGNCKHTNLGFILKRVRGAYEPEII